MKDTEEMIRYFKTVEDAITACRFIKDQLETLPSIPHVNNMIYHYHDILIELLQLQTDGREH